MKKNYCQTADYIFQDFLICTDEAYFQVPPAPPMPDFSNIEQLLGTEGSSAPLPESWPHGALSANPPSSATPAGGVSLDALARKRPGGRLRGPVARLALTNAHSGFILSCILVDEKYFEKSSLSFTAQFLWLSESITNCFRQRLEAEARGRGSSSSQARGFLKKFNEIHFWIKFHSSMLISGLEITDLMYSSHAKAHY